MDGTGEPEAGLKREVKEETVLARRHACRSTEMIRDILKSGGV
jgi:hypothetical protein